MALASDSITNPINAPSGSTVYAQFVMLTTGATKGYFWNGSALEAYNASNWATYDVAAPEDGTSGTYIVTIPASLPNGNYIIKYFVQSGGTPATTDTYIGSNDSLNWQDSAVVTNIVINDNVVDIKDFLVGPGADLTTITVEVSSVGVPDMRVWITSDALGSNLVAGTLSTNVDGEIDFLLDHGTTYYLWAYKSGVNPIIGESFVAASTNTFTTTNASVSSVGLISLTEAREIVRDSVLNVMPGSYSDAKIDRAIQFAGRLFMRETRCVVARANVTLDAGERYADVQDQIPDFNVWMWARAQITVDDRIYRVLRADYGAIQRFYESNGNQTGRPRQVGFMSETRIIMYPEPEIEYTMEVQYFEPLTSWTPGASGASVTLNIPADFVRDVLWFGAGTALLYGEQYQNLYAQKGWNYFMQLVKDTAGRVNFNSSDTYNVPDDGNGYNGAGVY